MDMRFEEQLRQAVNAPILSQLVGEEGAFAVTPEELVYIDERGVQRAPLKEIRRVASAKGGRLYISGKDETYIEASSVGFDLSELKLFFESVRGYVQKARRGELDALKEAAAEGLSTQRRQMVTIEAMATQERPPIVPEDEAAPAQAAEEPREAPPEPEAKEPAPSRGRDPLLLGLALLTWVYTALLLFLERDLEPHLLLGIALGGLGLGLVEWKVANR